MSHFIPQDEEPLCVEIQHFHVNKMRTLFRQQTGGRSVLKSFGQLTLTSESDVRNCQFPTEKQHSGKGK